MYFNTNKLFYNVASKEKNRLTENPQGVFDPEAFLLGTTKCFRIATTGKKLVKKTIIVNDFVCLLYKEKSTIIDHTVNLWDKLLADGFTLYFHTALGFEKVTQTYNLLNYAEKTYPISNKKIIAKLTEIKISPEKVFILDRFQTQLIANDIAIPTLEVDLFHALEEKNQTIILESIDTEAIFTCTNVINDACIFIAKYFLTKFPNVKFEHTPDNEILRTHLETLKKENSTSLFSSIEIDHKYTFDQTIQALEQNRGFLKTVNINMHSKKQIASLYYLLQDVEDLTLKNFQDNTWPAIHFPNLKSLAISSEQDCLEDISNLIFCSRLVKLSIGDLTISRWPALSLIYLKQITIVGLGLKDITELQALTKLESLKIFDYDGITSWPEISLPNLKELELDSAKLNNINNLSQCPRLQTLALINPKILSWPAVFLPELRSLKIESEKMIDITELQKWSKLETLELNTFKISKWPTMRLAALKSLTVFSPLTDFSQLANCPKLEVLRINANKIESWPQVVFPNLKVLELSKRSNGTVIIKDLTALGTSCPLLTKLDLSSLTSVSNFSLNNLTALTTLYLPKFPSRKFYDELLAQAPNSKLVELGLWQNENDTKRQIFAERMKKFQIKIKFLNKIDPTEDHSENFKDFKVPKKKLGMKMNATKFFEKIPPVHYRLKVGTLTESFKFKSSPENITTNLPFNPQCLDFNANLREISEQYQYYLGEKEFYNNGSWQYLPSHSPRELLTHFACNEKLTIGYNSDANLYAIKLDPVVPKKLLSIRFIIKTAADFDIQMLLPYLDQTILAQYRSRFNKMIQLLQNNKICSFPQPSHTDQIYYAVCLQEFFRSFKDKDLSSEPINDHALFIAIITEKAGVCAQRSIACACLAKKLKIKYRIIKNDIHMFLEVSLFTPQAYEYEWYRLDLGGGECEIIETPAIIPNIPQRIFTSDKSAKIPSVRTTTQSQPKSFITWNSLITNANNLNDYWSEIFNAKVVNHKNILIKFSMLEQIDIFTNWVEAWLIRQKFDYFYIDNASQISDNQFTVKILPGATCQKVPGPLMQTFATANPKKCIIINWLDFDFSEIAGYQDIYLDPRKLDNFNLGNALYVVGLIDQDKAKLLDESFYSRIKFGVISEFPDNLLIELNSFNEQQIAINNTLPPIIYNKVCLYHETNFKSELFYNIQLQTNGPIIKPKILAELILNKVANTNLVIQNAPDSREFKEFYRELTIKRKIFYNGEYLPLPTNFNLYLQQVDYNFINFKNCFSLSNDQTRLQQHNYYVLNSTTYHNFFTTTNFSNKERILTLRGWLASEPNSELFIFVNGALTDGQWAKLFSTAILFQKHLCIIIAATKYLPDQLKSSIAIIGNNQNMPFLNETNFPTHNAIILTNDILATEDFISKKIEFDLILTVTGTTTATDLIWSFNFTNGFKPGILWTTLAAGKTVLLKGSMSSNLNILQTLFMSKPVLIVNDARLSLRGKLFVIIDNETLPFYTSSGYQYKTQRSEIEQFPPIPVLNMCSKQNAQQYIQQRISLTKAALDKYKVVFIGGPTGTGKTTFVNKLPSLLSCKLFTGQTQIQDWLNYNSGCWSLLFFDEADLAPEDAWEKFSGMFNNRTPGILHANNFGATTSNHMIIFAGNIDYVDRNKHKFIQHYAQIIKFEELPDEYLFQEVISPILISIRPEEIKNYTANTMIWIYRKVLNEFSALITTRNLEMMCIYFIKQLDQPIPLFDLDLYEEKYHLNMRVAIAANQELKNLLTKQDLARFWGIFGMIFPPSNTSWYISCLKKPKLKISNKALQKFVFFDELHAPVQTLIADYLEINKLRIIRPELKHAGKRGILLIGEAGVGKTTLLVRLCKEFGYKQGFKYENHEHKFYNINASQLDFLAKHAILAAKSGDIIIVNEFNLLPLEDLFNNLLQGRDENGLPLSNEGFLLLATQNPDAGYTGRRTLSPAILNRLTIINLQYTPQKIFSILATLKVPEPEVTFFEFQKSRDFAKQNQLFPTPSLRHLLPGKRLHTEPTTEESSASKKTRTKLIRQVQLATEYQSKLISISKIICNKEIIVCSDVEGNFITLNPSLLLPSLDFNKAEVKYLTLNQPIVDINLLSNNILLAVNVNKALLYNLQTQNIIFENTINKITKISSFEEKFIVTSLSNTLTIFKLCLQTQQITCNTNLDSVIIIKDYLITLVSNTVSLLTAEGQFLKKLCAGGVDKIKNLIPLGAESFVIVFFTKIFICFPFKPEDNCNLDLGYEVVNAIQLSKSMLVVLNNKGEIRILNLDDKSLITSIILPGIISLCLLNTSFLLLGDENGLLRLFKILS